MSEISTASGRIVDEVTSWPGMAAERGSRGELSLRFGRREIGHLHGNRTAHFGFAKPLWHRLKAEGRIDFHPVFPDRPGPAARRIETEADVADVIALLRLNYDRMTRADEES
jgi:hypothetical protein